LPRLCRSKPRRKGSVAGLDAQHHSSPERPRVNVAKARRFEKDSIEARDRRILEFPLSVSHREIAKTLQAKGFLVRKRPSTTSNIASGVSVKRRGCLKTSRRSEKHGECRGRSALGRKVRSELNSMRVGMANRFKRVEQNRENQIRTSVNLNHPSAIRGHGRVDESRSPKRSVRRLVWRVRTTRTGH
jgi:hypothetical protein